MLAAPLVGNRPAEIALADFFSFIDDSGFYRLDTYPVYLSIGIAVKFRDVAHGIESQDHVLKFQPQETLDHLEIWLVEPDHFVEPSPDGRVQGLIEISRSDQETSRRDPINEDKQAVNDPAKLVVLATIITRARQSVEFVKE